MARILVCVAWPYTSGPRHIGHATSTFIPADVFARYHRMKGDEVLVVGGSDMHGTPTMVRADDEGVTARTVAERYHELHRKNIEQLGVRYDLYWNTADPNHKGWVQEIFSRLRERGHIFEAKMTSPFCTTDNRFLPDRYVEGTCPNCGYDRARGDQCDRCGHLWDPFELKEPRCRIHGTAPVRRETSHFFFRLTAFEEPLKKWMASGKEHWRHHVSTFTNSWLAEGLKDRPITRDLDWGIDVPVPGYESKRIYVWFEAVMGYLTATREWYRRAGRPEGWKDFWLDRTARQYYFIGKDNIVFHTIIWPAILMGYDNELTLPHDVPGSQFLNISGEKMSAGRGKGVWLPDLLERFDPDQIRYYCLATMPETKDTDFEWSDFARRNNNELLAVYGNFAHRVLTFADKNFESRVPPEGFLDAADRAMIRAIEDQWRKVGQNVDYVHLKDAIREAIHLARLGNQYFDVKAPWDLIKKDRAACGTAIHVALRVSRALAIIMAPFLPFSSTRLWTSLGFDTDVHGVSWSEALEDVPTGQSLHVDRPLFAKIELAQAEGGPADRLDVRAAQIVDVAAHPNADKLYVLQVDVGTERRQIVAGIRQNYSMNELRGRKIALLANLEPAKLRGIASNGMLLAGEDEKDVGLVNLPDNVPPGTQILGVHGAPTLRFSEFKKYRIEVGEAATVRFRGLSGEVDIPLRVADVDLHVDKAFKAGTPVH